MSGKFKSALALALAAALILVCGIPSALAKGEPDEPMVLLYTGTAGLLVYVDGSLSGELSRNDVICGKVVTLKAPATSGGKPFSRWAVGAADGPTASTQNPYKIAVNADTALYAVYGETADSAQAAVAFTTKVKEDYLGEDSIRLTATYSLPSGQEATEIGIRYTYNELLGAVDATAYLTAASVDGLNVSELLKTGSDIRVRETSGAASNAAGDWTLSLTSPGDDAYVYAMAFVKTGSGAVYSDLIKVRYQELPLGVIANANIDLSFTQPDLNGGAG